jgi:glycosyltransferase involved in cell wall biosynthesis
MTLVSIIIPCYNAEAYVADAIESALAQTHRPVEVIVVDDGSTDRSLDVMRSFAGRICWMTGPNRGACAARNRGLEAARGDVLQFLDADDLMHPEKLERQLPVLLADEKCIAFCLQDVVSLNPERVPAVPWNRRDACDDAVVFMLRGDVQTAAAIHHRRAVTAVGGFREHLPGAQDRDFHLRLALAGQHFRLVPQTLLTIRRRTGSISTSNAAEIERQRGIIAQEVYEQLTVTGALSDHRAAECAAMVLRASRGLFACGETADAYALIERAYALHPGGGVELVYSPGARRLRAVFGPRITESLVGLKRSMTTRRESASPMDPLNTSLKHPSNKCTSPKPEGVGLSSQMTRTDDRRAVQFASDPVFHCDQ